LENKVSNYNRSLSDSTSHSVIENDLLTIRNEVMQEMEDNYDVRPDFNPDSLTYDLCTPQLMERVQAYFDELRSFYIHQFKDASRERDNYISEQQQTPEQRKAYLDLKRNYHNESLSDFVTNNRETERIMEYNNRIYQKAIPIYLDPRNKYHRAHFYAPRKRIANWYVDTYWLNWAVVWGQSLLLYLCLYCRVLKKVLNRVGEFVEERKRRREKKVISRGTDESKSARRRRKAFQDLKIWR
jgi:hypothetical protein